MSDETELKVKLTAEDGISAVIDRVIESLGDTKLGHAITAVSTGFEAASHVLEKVERAFEAVKAKIDETIHAAAAHEVAEKKLAASLLITGNYSEEQVHKLDAMASSLAKASATSQLVIRDAMAMGVSLGISGDKIEGATAAATNLAAVMGVDVTTAMRQVAVTLSGSLGRLGLIIPELKGFTASQLQAGAAITFLNEKFKGYAATLSDTYQGAVTRADMAHHEFMASLGEFITQSTVVREALVAKAALYETLAQKIHDLQGWMDKHAEGLHIVAQGLQLAAIGLGIYIIAINIATISTIAATVASVALAAAIAIITSPITLVVAGAIALGVALAYLGVNTDHVIGVLKILMGAVLMPLTGIIAAVILSVGALVSIFSKSWGDSIVGAGTSLLKLNASLITNGVEQIKTGEAARKAAKDHKDNADAVHGTTMRVDEHEQALRRMSAEYARASENAKPAMDALKEFAPQLSLLDWQRDKKNFEEQLTNLQKSATIVVHTIQEGGGPKGESDSAMLAKAQADIQKASAAQTALKIKDFETTRDSAIKNADIWIEYEKQKVVSASQEIMLKRIAAAEETRAKLIDIKAAEFIQEQELHRHYLTISEEAQKKANDTDLNAYKQMLDAKLQLAVDHETEKAIAEDQAAKSVSGLDKVAKAQAEASLVEDVETAHQAKLNEALRQGLIERDAFDREMTASRLEQLKASHMEEIAAHQQKGELLGLSDDAVKQRQLESELAYKDELQAIADDKLLNEQERQQAYEEAEMTHTANMNQIREQNTQNEITRADQMHDYWAMTLAKIRLEQEKHGQIIGTIQGIQHSQQFQAANTMLTNLASLRNSHSKKAFEVGKAAAVAQATVQTFLAATEAYASLAVIPIVGPVLGALAAAAAVAAGVVNIQQIQSQKFNAAHGGIDEVPQSLDNSTFLLKGGERVLQPEANQDMTQAAKTINEGGGRGNTIQITVYGDVPDSQLKKITASVVEGLRDLSERGTPIINEKGIVKAS